MVVYTSDPGLVCDPLLSLRTVPKKVIPMNYTNSNRLLHMPPTSEEVRRETPCLQRLCQS